MPSAAIGCSRTYSRAPSTQVSFISSHSSAFSPKRSAYAVAVCVTRSTASCAVLLARSMFSPDLPRVLVGSMFRSSVSVKVSGLPSCAKQLGEKQLLYPAPLARRRNVVRDAAPLGVLEPARHVGRGLRHAAATQVVRLMPRRALRGFHSCRRRGGCRASSG